MSRCNDCDVLLWSDESKSLGLCPECREEPLEGDLEDQLEQLLEESPE